MNALYNTESTIARNLFREADETYAAIKLKVQQNWVELPESEVERRLFDDGAELLRQLLQSHVTLRGQARPVEPVVGTDGSERTHIREETGEGRPIESIFGTVHLQRIGYRGRGLSLLQPVDADLNLAPGRYSLEVERRVALDAARSSFDATGDAIARTTHASVAKRQIEELTRRAAVDFDEFYARREFDPGVARDTGPLLILTFDQKGIVMRKEDLLDATRKIADGEARKLHFIVGGPDGRIAGWWARRGERGVGAHPVVDGAQQPVMGVVKGRVERPPPAARRGEALVERARKMTNPTPARGWGAKPRLFSLVLSRLSALFRSTSHTAATGHSRHRPRHPVGRLRSLSACDSSSP